MPTPAIAYGTKGVAGIWNGISASAMNRSALTLQLQLLTPKLLYPNSPRNQNGECSWPGLNSNAPMISTPVFNPLTVGTAKPIDPSMANWFASTRCADRGAALVRAAAARASAVDTTRFIHCSRFR
jgi:hypothetical protein